MNEDELTQQDIDEYNKRRQEEYDEATKGNEEIRRKQEERVKENKIKGFDPSKSSGLDEEFKRQKKLQEDDLTAEEEFGDAQNLLKNTGEVLYTLGQLGIFAITKSPQALQTVNSLRNKLEGKPYSIPTVNPIAINSTTNLTESISPYELSSESGTEIISQLKDKITSNSPITITSTGNVPNIVMGGPGSGRKKKAILSPGQMGLDFSYVELGNTIKQPLTDADLTQEEMIRYAQQNAENASVNIEDYLAQFGASTVLRKAIRTDMLKPFQQKYGATDEQVRRFAKLANRNTKDIAKTIKYLNYEYKLFQPGLSELRGANIQDIAEEMSIVYGQDIDANTIDSIIKGQGGEIIYQTDGMKGRGEDPISIKTREDLLNVYNSRIKLLNTHGAFDKGHVYAADQLLKDNNVSNASMYRNLEPEIRASIRQLVSKPELNQLINGQLSKGTDYIEAVIGNRSKKAGGDPGDKIFERLYGNAYGLEEDFRNYLFPKQNLANMIHPDLKPIFGQKYTRIVKQKVKNFEGTGTGPKLKVGSHSLNIIRLEAMKEVLEDYVAGTEITEEEEKAQKSLAKVQVFLDFVTNKEMTYKGEIRKGNE